MLQFTGARYNRLVEPSRQATFEYGFTPSDTFSSRPFGLTINVNYKDTVGAASGEFPPFKIASVTMY